jgi:hypothetical protein
MEIEDRARAAKARLRAVLEKIGQTKNMTQEEGERYWKAKIVPDSEQEES